ncbi:MAG: hypothetical protein LBH42_03935 [Treponema sp.]|nr:hypothetical protein [Treponema sp.]
MLVIILFIVPPEGGFTLESSASGVFPVYLSSNALFLLMALFVWIRPMECRNYLDFFMAGKIIALVSFYVWIFFFLQESLGIGNRQQSFYFFASCFLINVIDISSVCVAWAIKRKYRHTEILESSSLTAV